MDKKVVISFFVQLLVFINTVLMAKGILTFQEVTVDEIYTAVSLIVQLAAVIYGCWKNHSITPAAQAADEIMHLIKAGDLTAVDLMEVDEYDD